ncbi:alginate lyase family protein [Psychrobacter sp. I-STPA10]|uniref:alginate lyase family protein n=1 Tax=Psychrobacter sp. I-STPA10 TaxID=2585769 RepID=UPI001E3DF4F3|nr:alginate lyase family protein [Psychrobacter sp. I-STPA10]
MKITPIKMVSILGGSLLMSGCGYTQDHNMQNTNITTKNSTPHFLTESYNFANFSKPLFQSMLLDKADWQALRQQPEAYPQQTQALLRSCQDNLDRDAQPVAILDVQPHYNNEGVNEQGRAAAKQLANDGWLSYRAALCYQLTGNKRYAKQSQQILDAWATTLKQVKGRQAKADINFDLPSFIMAGYWVQGVNDWDDSHWRTFLRDIILPQSAANDSDNNHGNWGVLLNTSMAVYLQDKNLLDKSYQRWQALLQSQISDKGVFTKEICRSDSNNYCGGETKGINGISYTHYAMLPTSITAQIFAQQGKPVWHSPAGKLLGKAYQQTAIWTQSPSQFPYYQRNNGKLNGVRNGAYFVILQRHYPNEAGANAIKQGDLKMDGFQLLSLF